MATMKEVALLLGRKAAKKAMIYGLESRLNIYNDAQQQQLPRKRRRSLLESNLALRTPPFSAKFCSQIAS